MFSVRNVFLMSWIVCCYQCANCYSPLIDLICCWKGGLRTAEGHLLNFFVGMTLQRWTKETTTYFVLSICVKHSAFIMLYLLSWNVLLNQSMLLMYFYHFSVSPVIFLTADMLAHFCSDRSFAVNMYIIISYVSSDLHHMFMVSLFFKGEHQDVTVLVPLVHFF